MLNASTRRRLAALLFLIAVALGVSTFSKNVRHENTLIFRFDPDLSAKVRRLSASWTPAGEIEPSGGVTLNFAHGPGREVRQVVLVPNGDYVISLDVEPDVALLGSPTARRVTLTGTEVVIPIRARGDE